MMHPKLWIRARFVQAGCTGRSLSLAFRYRGTSPAIPIEGSCPLGTIWYNATDCQAGKFAAFWERLGDRP